MHPIPDAFERVDSKSECLCCQLTEEVERRKEANPKQDFILPVANLNKVPVCEDHITEYCRMPIRISYYLFVADYANSMTY